ncbi:MAG: 3-isopropylmalate dehydratase large subunit [Candidatus Hydrogenedentota bacterium]
MGLTLAEKILSLKVAKGNVKAQEIIEAKVDLVLANDITAPLAIKAFYETGVKKVFDKKKIALVCDHFTPNKDIKSALQVKFVREFAKEQGIENFWEIGRVGIEHALLPESGFVHCGDLIIGADSHTCTYGALSCFATGVGSTDVGCSFANGRIWLKIPETIKVVYKGRLNRYVYGKDLILYTIGRIGVDGANYRAIEFSGEVVDNLTIFDRLTISNMAVETGAKCGLFIADDKTIDYLNKHNQDREVGTILYPDKDADYKEIIEIDCDNLEPVVSCPHLPSNVKFAKELKDVKIDQVVIGSCTNGWYRDIKLAAEILDGKKVDKNIRTIIIPATQKIYLQLLKDGYIEKLIDSGCAISTPTCGPCLGGHMGILAKGERAIATTNRNFVGRMGHTESEVYLANPAVAAASAITGYIIDPNELELY